MAELQCNHGYSNIVIDEQFNSRPTTIDGENSTHTREFHVYKKTCPEDQNAFTEELEEKAAIGFVEQCTDPEWCYQPQSAPGSSSGVPLNPIRLTKRTFSATTIDGCERWRVMLIYRSDGVVVPRQFDARSFDFGGEGSTLFRATKVDRDDFADPLSGKFNREIYVDENGQVQEADLIYPEPGQTIKYNGQINVDDTGKVQGTPIQSTYGTYTVHRRYNVNIDQNIRDWFLNLNTVNAYAWPEAEAINPDQTCEYTDAQDGTTQPEDPGTSGDFLFCRGEMLLINVRIEEQTNGWYNVAFDFAVRPTVDIEIEMYDSSQGAHGRKTVKFTKEGWQYYWVEYQDDGPSADEQSGGNTDKSVKQVPNRVMVDCLYPYRDFTMLVPDSNVPPDIDPC